MSAWRSGSDPPGDPDDVPAVVGLAPRLTIGVAPWRDVEAVSAAVRRWVESSAGPEACGAAFVCVTGDEVIGFVSVSSTEHFAGERDAYIGELIVDHRFERRGGGRLLVDAAERWARQAGYRCITLHTGVANDRARSFYARLGYVEEDVKLTKLLDSPSSPKT
jgi:ribosomal protein S18 acetylase RimI-like enzyme